MSKAWLKRFHSFPHKTAIRRVFIIAVSLLLAYTLFGFLILPRLIGYEVKKLTSEKLHRSSTIGKIDVNPFALTLAVHDFKLMEPQGGNTFASFDALNLNLSSESILKLAPIVRQVQLLKPYIHLVRSSPHHYNIDDLLALASQPSSPHQTRHFSINNIRVSDGRIEFDDKPDDASHTISDITLGVPFISSLPSQVNIFVQPVLHARVDGTPLQLSGKARPYAATREATMGLDFDGLDLTRYVAYLPFRPRFKLASGSLDAHLDLNFRQEANKAPQLTLAGRAALEKVRATTPDGAPLLTLPQLSAELHDADLLGGRFDLDKVVLQSPDLHLSRNRAGRLNLQDLAAPVAATPVAPPAPAPASASAYHLQLALDQLDVRNAALHYSDANPALPLQANAQKLDLSVHKLTINDAAKKISVGQIRLDVADAAAHDDANAATRLQAHLQKLGLSAEQVALDETGNTISANEIRLDLPDAAVHYNGPNMPMPLQANAQKLGLSVHKVTLDETGKKIRVDQVVSDHGQLLLSRAKPTSAPARDATTAAATPAPAGAAPKSGPGNGGYAVQVAGVKIDHWSVRVEDQTRSNPLVTQVGQLNLSLKDVSTAAGSTAQVALDAAIDKNGRLKANGSIGFAPFHAELALNASKLDLLPLQPLIADKLNLKVTSAALDANGKLQLQTGTSKGLQGSFAGDASVDDLATVDAVSGQSFLRWKSLAFRQMKLQLSPFALGVGDAALNDFFARVTINPNGRINLQDIMRAGSDSAGGKDRKAAANDNAGANASARNASETQGADKAGAMPPIDIRRLHLQGGRVRFTDNFIKPNYSARLVDLAGDIKGLSSQPSTAASVDLHGMVNDAPLSVTGRVNPLQRNLFLDLQANVRGMELAALTPYADKYIGYGIEKGKLSFQVSYHVENRHLTASNRLILNQLTLTDKSTGPAASKWPVKLAIALLQNRDGVIDVNVPVQGSLNDPQFSIGGIVMKVIGHAIVKAVSQPFALLGSLFGGSEHGELSSLAFAPGSASIPDDATKKLDTLAKALVNRPALKLDITGWADRSDDVQGLKREALDRKMRALKRKDMQAQGQSVDFGKVTVSKDEYPALLARVYKDAKFPKPRNAIGLQKTVPVPDMEHMLLDHEQIDQGDLLALANRRAQAVKDWLLKFGHVPGERMFILASKIDESGKQGKGAKAPLSKVEFSLH